jgi:hypothetical protein
MRSSSAQTTGLVQAFYERIWNAGDMNAAAEIRFSRIARTRNAGTRSIL